MMDYFTISSPRLQIYNVIDLFSTILNTFLNVLGILIITTGLLLITNIQLMSVEDREFQTGVLRAVGDNRRGILTKYLLETIVQGLVGGFFGLFEPSRDLFCGCSRDLHLRFGVADALLLFLRRYFSSG